MYIQNDIVTVWRNGLYKIVWAWAISVRSTKAAHQTLLNLYLLCRKPFIFLSFSFSPSHNLSFFRVTLMEFLCNLLPSCTVLKRLDLFMILMELSATPLPVVGHFGPYPKSVIVSALCLPFGLCCWGTYPFCC